MPHDLIALDRESVRSYDKDGRLHVSVTNISKANICSYFGKEIPNAERLGLEPTRMYRLWRHPEELERGASTFNGIPLLMKHVPVTALSIDPSLIIGTTGTTAHFVDPYLRNGISVWLAHYIAAIESDLMKELSSAYHYEPDMTPGYADGQPYDGIMRNIVGNHVALVEDGRAGDDVVVGDQAIARRPTVWAGMLGRFGLGGGMWDPRRLGMDAFEEGAHPRGEGGKFAKSAAGASEGAAHHMAKYTEHKDNGPVRRAHARAARHYSAALEHHEAGRTQEAEESHAEAEKHGQEASRREGKFGDPKQKPVEQKPAEQKPAEQKPAEQKPAEQKPGIFGRGTKAEHLDKGKLYHITSLTKSGEMYKTPERQKTPGLTSHLDPERAAARLEAMHTMNPGSKYILQEHSNEQAGRDFGKESQVRRISRYLSQKPAGHL